MQPVPPDALALVKYSSSIHGKPILHEITASFHAGLMTAVMGASGAGKSVLLHALAGDAPGTSTGSVKLNNTSINSGMPINLVCQNEEQTRGFECLTVLETLEFAARLRVKDCDYKHVAMNVIVSLDLEECSSVCVANISGGQQKRLSVGISLLDDPSVLLLDEPTSGLDGPGAHRLVDMLCARASGRNSTVLLLDEQNDSKTSKNRGGLELDLELAENPGNTVEQHRGAGRGWGRQTIVVCVIHQPSMAIFNRFSRILFLDHGHMVYMGAPSEAEAWIVGGFLPRSDIKSPLFPCSSDQKVENNDVPTRCLAAIAGNRESLITKWKERQIQICHQIDLTMPRTGHGQVGVPTRRPRPSFCMQIKTASIRMLHTTVKGQWGRHAARYACIGFVVGLIYWGQAATGNFWVSRPQAYFWVSSI